MWKEALRTATLSGMRGLMIAETVVLLVVLTETYSTGDVAMFFSMFVSMFFCLVFFAEFQFDFLICIL